jgi:hypothetical protein
MKRRGAADLNRILDLDVDCLDSCPWGNVSA